MCARTRSFLVQGFIFRVDIADEFRNPWVMSHNIVKYHQSIPLPVMRQLGEILRECVEGGASVSFMLPFTNEDGLAFWRGVNKRMKEGELVVFVAFDKGFALGTSTLVLAQPPNQPHRGDISKMLVRPSARRLGVGEAVLMAAEVEAKRLEKSLLVLDTASHAAEKLYEKCGWQRVGAVPHYAMNPDGSFCDTVFYYKTL
jgi:ribosomal protein S18 acetylase RimI-like enzyme